MIMEKLISMADFVLSVEDYTIESGNYKRSLELIYGYATFLKHPLKLEMFVPCDVDGNVLQKPQKITYFDPTEPIPKEVEQEYYDYLTAKEKVLFENCSMFDEFMICFGEGNLIHLQELPNTNIEWLCDENLTLTPNAIKQLRL